MFKKINLLITVFLFFFFASATSAFKAETFVTFTNPIRGPEGWSNSAIKILDLPKIQYAEATASAHPITWALRYDAVNDASASAFFESLSKKDKTQSIGAFMEITPSLTAAAKIQYPEGLSIFDANRVFLSGYSLENRLKLIDVYMESFFTRFGYYPKIVVAWHLDSYSLKYLQSKYSILAAMNCDDQYSTDNYRLWGGYLGSAYFPDKNNSLIPASSFDNRINLAMVRWAQRDLFNFYGSQGESLYSVQVNDYLKINKDTSYFGALLSIYSQKTFNEFTYLNIGLENDNYVISDRLELSKITKLLKTEQERNNLRFISLADFGDWFKARYPESSPAYLYQTTDPAKQKSGTVYWYYSPFYRIGLKSDQGQTKITDFRVYNRNVYEEYYATPNQTKNLYQEIPAIIDTVKFPLSEVVLDIDLEKFTSVHSKTQDMWEIAFRNGTQKLILDPDKIIFENFAVPTLQSDDIKVTTTVGKTVWMTSPERPELNKSKLTILFWIVSLLLLIFIVKKKPRLPRLTSSWLVFLVGIVCVFVTGLTVFMNGQVHPFGVGFSGPNGHDAIFHLSLIEKFATNPFNLNHPQISDEKLTNYHFVFDYFSGIIVRLFGVSSIFYYFVVFPIIAGVTIVILLNKLFTIWKFSKIETTVSYLLIFLGGSLGFIPKIFSGQDIFAGESAFWSNQSISLFLNPPFALSVTILLLFLVLYSRHSRPDRESIEIKSLLVLSLLGGILAQTKVYAFVLLLGALFFQKKFKLLFGVLLVGGIISMPFASVSGSPFLFDPLWFPRSLFASYDRFFWPKLVQAWQSYEASGVFEKLILLNIFATFVFLVGNLGIRIVGLIGMFFTKASEKTEALIRSLVILGIVIPLLFIQKINPWNTIQFMYYSLFFLAPMTARTLLSNNFLSKKFAGHIFLVSILLVGIFTSLGTLKDYFGFFTSSRISFTEMQALNKLRSEPDGIVLAPPINSKSSRIYPPKPLYAYVSTAYISAFSGKSEYLSDTINLDITGFDYRDKSRNVQRFYNTEDKDWATSFLKSNNIKFIYETPLQKMRLSPADIQLTKIFDSGEINIYTRSL